MTAVAVAGGQAQGGSVIQGRANDRHTNGGSAPRGPITEHTAPRATRSLSLTLYIKQPTFLDTHFSLSISIIITIIETVLYKAMNNNGN